MRNDIAIYSFRVAQSLIKDGYKLLNIKLNSRMVGKVVFYFENNEETKLELRNNYNIKID